MVQGLCAVVCAGQVFLLQHDVGLLVSAECCKPAPGSGSTPVCSVEWCGELLACGEDDGSVRMWRLTVSLVDPRTPAVGLRVESHMVGVLPPPESAAPYLPVTTMQWTAAVADSGGDGDGDGDGASSAGVLACGCGAIFRAWSLTPGGKATLATSMPVAPLKGAEELVLSSVLSPISDAAAAAAAAAASSSSSARALDADAQPRWLLCGASGSPSVFALPWGRASGGSDAAVRFPGAAGLLGVPSLQLTPAPAVGLRGVHTLASAKWRRHYCAAFAFDDHQRLFEGADPAHGGCDILLVLSDKALHVLAHVANARQAAPPHASAPGLAHLPLRPSEVEGGDVGLVDDEATARMTEAVAPPPPHAPLVAHLLPPPPRAQRAASHRGRQPAGCAPSRRRPQGANRRRLLQRGR